MIDDKKIVELVETLAVQTFSRRMVEGVRVRRDIDHDGDHLVWINVLMRDGSMPLDPGLTLPFGLALRRAIHDIGETSLPVLSFYSKSEFRQIYPEAA